MSNSRSTPIMISIAAGVLALIVGTTLFFALKKEKEPPVPPADQTNTTETIEQTDPPIIVPVTDDTTSTDLPPEVTSNDERPGELVVDITEDQKNNKKSDEPSIDGDVYIIPGVKGEDE